MRDKKATIKTAPLLLIPPVVGSIAYLAPFRAGVGFAVWNSLYIASGSILWWPLSLFLNRRTFVAGLIGLHVMMAWFLFAMSKHWGDDLGWILYLPALFIGSAAAIAVSEFARKANQWMNRTQR
jgi:hypothetical protein